MAAPWERDLDRWLAASLIDAETAARIREFEAGRNRGSGFRWPVIAAVAIGAVLLGAGVLLFVSAHWDKLSPAWRMTLVALLVGGFHAGGALSADRFAHLSVALHAIGTFALGAGIFLAGQIFHLQAHWPAGIMLWAAGAFGAWLLLRQWPQAAIAALLIPYWIGGEWIEFMRRQTYPFAMPVSTGVFLLAITYLGALPAEPPTSVRRALAWIGGLALMPAGAILLFDRPFSRPSWEYQAAGLALAIVLPASFAFYLRGRAAIAVLGWAGWALVPYFVERSYSSEQLFTYVWSAVAAVGLVAWGISEQRIERINLGMAAFALTVLGYYFSSVMDKLGRSATLISLGVLFLAGGWAFERLRRRLVAQVQERP